jgi:hypothetical protein
MVTWQEVEDFLNQFKTSSELGRHSEKVSKKNIQALIDLGLTASERRKLLMRLQPSDYVAGPKADDWDETKQVWEFGKTVGGTQVYIKLQVIDDPKTRRAHRAVLWSFHPAEFPLKYPLKGSRS